MSERKKIDTSAIESSLSTPQMVIARPAALFDPYTAIAALDEVVNAIKEKKDERAARYEIMLRQCHPLLNNQCLQQVLIKLVVSKEEAEVAKVIAKATKRPVPVNHGSFSGRVGLHTRGLAPISALDHLRRGRTGCVVRRGTSRALVRTSVKDCVISKSDLF